MDALELEQKKLFWKKFNAVSNIVLIIWLLIIGGYVAWKVVPEIENFKILNKDVCRLCEQKTGGVCAIQTIPYSDAPLPNDYLKNINISIP